MITQKDVVMKINLMTVLRNYQAKWLAADIALITDIFANGVWGNEYYKMFEVLGIQASTVNAGISGLQILRVFILLYQGAAERQLKETNNVSRETLTESKR